MSIRAICSGVRASALVLVSYTLCAQAPLRPPAVPLIVHDPYFSVWSMGDELTGSPTKHWTGTDQPLNGLVRIDGATYRFMGTQPREAAPMKQVSRVVTPTQTAYGFDAAGVHLAVTFLTPVIASDMDLVSRPVTYLIVGANATDSRTHNVSVFLDAGSQLAVNSGEQKVVSARYQIAGMQTVRLGSAEQPVLGKSGDNLRIDWGYFYLAAPGGQVAAGNRDARMQFAASGAFPAADDLDTPRAANNDGPTAAGMFDLGPVGTSVAERHFLLAYDDGFSVEYFQRRLRPWWRRKGMTAATLLTTAEAQFGELRARCQTFDPRLNCRLSSRRWR